MIKLKELTKLLLNEKKLYDECGLIFKYLAEVRINFSTLTEHNIPWQMSQIIEIVYSNKLDKINLNVFDTIIAYSTNYQKDEKAKIAAWANFEATYFVSKLRKDKEGINLKSIEKIIEIIQKNYDPSLIDKNEAKSFSKSFDEESLSMLNQMLNGKFSNNPLYFFPLYLLIIEFALKDIKHKNVIRSVLLNLYLIKNKLLFAPTICFSYPLLFNIKKYEELMESVYLEDNKIIDFSRFIFELLKESAVVSRAFIMDFSKVSSNLNNLYNQESKLFKDLQINVFLKLISINEKILMEAFSLKSKAKAKNILNLLIENKLIVEMDTLDKQKLYVYKEILTTVKKLSKNKSEKTTKIFILKENLN